MSSLVQLIYCSAAARAFSSTELQELLVRARAKNAELGLTGILLYSDGSFFQVLEGEPATVDAIFETISRDDRHTDVTVIIREAISHRSFDAWTMGYASLTPEEAESILGVEHSFGHMTSFDQDGSGRARKLLRAFQRGRWRTRVDQDEISALSRARHLALGGPEASDTRSQVSSDRPYSFAFQPIVDSQASTIFSYEALVRGAGDEPADSVLERVGSSKLHAFDEESRVFAIELAARLGLAERLNLNFLPRSIASSPTAISSTLDAAARFGLPAERIILEVLEREVIDDFDGFNAAVNEHRTSGLLFAIDDFGCGHAGLSLLADFLPEFVKLDMGLLREIHRKGPRQAIVRGILRTCFDLGIEVIAEGVETEKEYQWLRHEGIRLFQGFLFAAPVFEELTLPRR